MCYELLGKQIITGLKIDKKNPQGFILLYDISLLDVPCFCIGFLQEKTIFKVLWFLMKQLFLRSQHSFMFGVYYLQKIILLLGQQYKSGLNIQRGHLYLLIRNANENKVTL